MPPVFKLNEVTWYSRILALVIFFGVVPLLAFYAGTKYQEVKTLYESEQTPSDIYYLSKNNVSNNDLKTNDSHVAMDINENMEGQCTNDISLLHPDLYEEVQTNLRIKYPAYIFDVKKLLPNGEVMNMYPNAVFHCSLNDGSYLASFVYSDSQEGEFPPMHFRIVRFDSTGEVLNISKQNESPSVGGQLVVENVSNSILKFTSRVIDPCYDSLHSYTLNLVSGEYSEIVEGGEDAACYEELNSHGGV